MQIKDKSNQDGEDQYSPSEKTKDDYYRKVNGLVRQFLRETEYSEFFEFQGEFVEWFFTQGARDRWSKATWKQYRSALNYVFRNEQDVFDSTLDRLNDEIPQIDVTQGNRTQSARVRYFRDEDLEAIVEELDQKSSDPQSRWHIPLIHCLHASILCGLRPLEWHTARLDNESDPPELTVVNSKNTAGRAHGKTRTLILEDVTDEQMYHLKSWLSECPNDEQFMKPVYLGMAQLLKRTNRRLWPDRKKYSTLKSCRHQFCADAKSAGLPLAEIAALMGHATDATASETYGKRPEGSGRFPIRGDDEEIEKVREVYEARRTDLEKVMSLDP